MTEISKDKFTIFQVTEQSRSRQPSSIEDGTGSWGGAVVRALASQARWKTRGRGCGVPGYGVPGCGKRGVRRKTRGLVENARYGGKSEVRWKTRGLVENAGWWKTRGLSEKHGVPLFFAKI